MKKIQSILQSDIDDHVILGGAVPAGKDAPAKNMYAAVLTTRCGDYERAKKNRMEILHRVWSMI